MNGTAAGVPGVLLALRERGADSARGGVLLRGPAGSGKSTLALALLDRGHALVADDLALLASDGDRLVGRGDARLAGFLHSRELGVVNVAKLFGDAALVPRCELRLIIDLECRDTVAPDPLRGAWRIETLLGQRLPQLSLRAGDGRALLIECALRELALRDAGYSACRELARRQRRLLDARTNAACG